MLPKEYSSLLFTGIFEKLPLGFAMHKCIFDENNNPIDYEFVFTNPQFEKITGLNNAIGKKITSVIPNIKSDRFDWIGMYGNIVKNQTSYKFIQYSEALNKDFSVTAYAVDTSHFITIFDEVSHLEKYKNYIHKSTTSLNRQMYDLELRTDELIDLNNKLFDASIKDELTGAFNRQFLEYTLKREIRNYTTSGRKFVSIFIDIDFFKDINDKHGHLFGDKVLISLTEQIQGCLRSSDMVIRFGGDEFLIIIPNSDYKNGKKVAMKIKKALDKNLIINNIKIEISGGIIEYNGESKEEYLRKLDEKLYEAKNDGRNKIC